MSYTKRVDQRFTTLHHFLTDTNLDAVLISDPYTIFYLTNFPSFSKDEREAFLLVTKQQNYLFTDGRYTEAVRKKVPQVHLQEITGEDSFADLYLKLLTKEKLKKIGFEEENLTYAEFSDISSKSSHLVPVSLEDIRIIKTPQEIELIRYACALGDETFAHCITLIKEGITEKYLAREIEIFMKQKGHDISFRPIVAFGEQASMPHHESNDRTLRKNEFVLIDMGAKVHNYCSDMTRCIFFGQPSVKQKEVYGAVCSAQQKAIDYIAQNANNTQGIRARDVDTVARKHITDLTYPNFSHSLGHGVGLQVHESPTLSPQSEDELMEGMVFSIEPGIYLPKDIGIRIEDLVTIQDGTVVQLTHATKELICVQ